MALTPQATQEQHKALQLDVPTMKRKQANSDRERELPSSSPAVLKRVRVSCPHLPSPSPRSPPALADLACSPAHVADRFTMSEAVLGSGQYGTVRECTDLETGHRFACKTITKSAADADLQAEDLRAEVEMMSRLQGHDSLVQLRGVFEDSDSVHLVMDLCEGGELYDEIVQRGKFSERDAAHIFAELARAVAFCHSRGVVHRDLKPENILLARRLRPHHPVADQLRQAQGPVLKLADFGLAVALAPGQQTTGVAGSPLYMAPEVLTGQYGSKADVWSLGVILYILLTGSPPFQGDTDDETFEAILRDSPDTASPAWRGVSLEARSLVRRLLVKDPAQRPPAHKILSHPWVVHHLTPGRAVGAGRMGPLRLPLSVPAL